MALQRRVVHAGLTQHRSARSPDLAIADRLAPQGAGNVLNEQSAHSRMQRRGAPHDLIELIIGECERC
jgi:hypothetical protein